MPSTTKPQGGLSQFMNFGQGHGRAMTSTMPLMGHALSGTPLGADRGSARRAPHLYSALHYAEGGKVQTNGPTAKERKDMRDMIERGKQDALETLRQSRTALLDMMPQRADAITPDYDAALDRLKSSLAMQEGGAVVAEADGSDEEAHAESGDPTALYQEYLELLAQLQDPQLDSGTQMRVVERLSQLEGALESLGIDVGENAGAAPG